MTERGRPAFEPTKEQRDKVKLLAGLGTPQHEIARHIRWPGTGGPICEETLRQHFREELDVGRLEADALLRESLFNQAVGRAKVTQRRDDGTVETLREAAKPDKSVAIFLAKVRLGMSEKLIHEVMGKDGAPMELRLSGADKIIRAITQAVPGPDAEDGSPRSDD